MKKLEYKGLFPEWEIKAIGAEARRFLRKYRNLLDNCYDYNDLIQEGVMAWWKAKQKFNAGCKAINPSPSTIVRNRLYDLLRRSKTQKRAEEKFALSIEVLQEKEAI
jgi:DNA-directed RNA polymerase specialized sigma24 family protein